MRDVEVTRQFIITSLWGREGIAFPSQYTTGEETGHSDRHHSHRQHQQGNKNILLQEDVDHFCVSTDFASLNPTSQRDLTSFYHAYRVCLRMVTRAWTALIVWRSECCITRKEMRSLVNYVDDPRVLQIRPLNWPAPSSILCMPSISQRKPLWNYWEERKV